MNIIKIGEPVKTKVGTIISRYIEDGRLYKSIDFSKSKNSVAKQKGLIKTVVRYGEGNKPETLLDTFERQLKRAVNKPEQNTINSTGAKRGRKPKTQNPILPKATTPQVQPGQPKIEHPKTKPSKVETKKPEIKKTMSKPKVKTESIASNSDGSQKLVPISINSFKCESAKTLFSKMRQYVNLIGQNGTIDKEVRIMSEKSSIPDSNYFLNKDADVFMTIKRSDRDLLINLTRRTADKSNNMVLLEATLNKDGQMINGRYPLHHLTFERYGANVRRMKKYGEQYLPIAENDREWDFCGKRLTGSPSDIRSINSDDCVGGAFEVFIELARLHTSVLK